MFKKGPRVIGGMVGVPTLIIFVYYQIEYKNTIKEEEKEEKISFNPSMSVPSINNNNLDSVKSVHGPTLSLI